MSKKPKPPSPETIIYTVEVVEYLCRNSNHLEKLKEEGDMDASILLMDVAQFMHLAEPTEAQKVCLDLIWFQGYSLREASHVLNITAQGIYFNLKLFKKKLQKVLDRHYAKPLKKKRV